MSELELRDLEDLASGVAEVEAVAKAASVGGVLATSASLGTIAPKAIQIPASGHSLLPFFD